jgi:hypothetical protein
LASIISMCSIHVALCNPFIEDYTEIFYMIDKGDIPSIQCKTTTTTHVKFKVTLRLTVSQSVSLGVEPNLGLMTRYLLLFDSYGLVFVGRPL